MPKHVCSWYQHLRVQRKTATYRNQAMPSHTTFPAQRTQSRWFPSTLLSAPQCRRLPPLRQPCCCSISLRQMSLQLVCTIQYMGENSLLHSATMWNILLTQLDQCSSHWSTNRNGYCRSNTL